MRILLWMVTLSLISAHAMAATYSLGSGGLFTPNNPPPCSGGSWSRSGSVFTCSGRVVLADGDEVYVSTAFFEGLDDITVVANNGFELNNNIIGTNAKQITLQSGYGSINASGSSVLTGSIISASGPITLNNMSVTGSITTQSTLTMTGGDVGGNISANNGVNLNAVTVSGTITASTGSISLTGGLVNGLVRSQCCTVTSNGTDLLGGLRSDVSSISITGGTLSGDFYAGNNPATFTGVTLVSGSVSGASSAVFNNSSLGSPASSITVSTQSGPVTLNDTTAYGDFTTPVWSSVFVNGNSTIIGSCTPGSTPAQACQALPVPTCLSDNFNRSSLGSDWISSRFSGTFTPDIVSNRLLLTQNRNEQSTATTLQRVFPADRNLIVIELDHFAWSPASGTGADGITVVFSDANITPQAGSFGGSLGYAQRDNGDPGFAGGWLGIALDEYGNFSNPTEGRLGGPGFRPQNITIRGSGVGGNGYRHLRTQVVSPAIDRRGTNTPSPGYRYRFTIDARVAGQTLVSVERNRGGGYESIIPAFNVVGLNNQAPIPDNLLLSFTGATGGSVNNHAIDNLQVCADRINPIGPTIHHFEFQFPGQGITCSPQNVLVRACANAACSQLYTDPVTVNLTPSGWVGGDTATFSGGQTTLQFRGNIPGTYSVGISSSVPTTQAFTTNTCSRDGGALSTNCSITFTDSGFVVQVPDFIAGAGTDSALLKAVKKDDTTQACVPGFVSVSKTISFWSDYVNPGPAGRVASLPLSINGNDIGNTEASATSLNVTFNAAGEAPLQVNYTDAGLMQLNTRLVASGDDSGLVMTGSGQFSSRPAGFCVRAGGGCGSPYESCAVAAVAGDDFSLQVQAVGADTDGDGDLCTGTQPAPSFSMNNVQIGSQLVAPAGGVNGVISPASYDHVSAVNNLNTPVIRQSEAGVFQFTVTPVTNYLGHSIPAGISQPGGRFIPARFAVAAANSGSIAPFCSTSSGFAYSGQDMNWQVAPQLQITALNRQGVTTRNYTQPGFMRLTAAALQGGLSPSGTDSSAQGVDGNLLPVTLTAQPGLLQVTALDSGVMNYDFSALDIWRYGKSLNSRTAPFAPQLSLNISNIQDSDNVPVDSFSWQPSAAFELRYGRLQLENAYGPETQSLTLPIRAQYWNGSRYVLNTDDSCWAYSAANATLNPAGLTSVSGQNGILLQGEAPAVALTAPGSGNTGTVQVDYAVPVFLQDDFSGAGLLENPSGLATFGIFRGHDRIIYWREVGR